MRAALEGAVRGTFKTLSMGFLCAGLFSLVVQPTLRLAFWLALHLAESAPGRGAVATLAMGLVLAAIVLVTLGLLALVLEVSRPVAICAGVFAAAMPSLVLLIAQGPEALLPAPVLAMRLFTIVLGGLAGGFGRARALRMRGR